MATSNLALLCVLPLLLILSGGVARVSADAAAWAFNSSTDVKLTIISVPSTGTASIAVAEELIGDVGTGYTSANPEGEVFPNANTNSVSYDPANPTCLTYDGSVLACEGETVEVTTLVYAVVELACTSEDATMMHLRWRYSVADTTQSFIVISPTASYLAAAQYNATDILSTMSAFFQQDTCTSMAVIPESTTTAPTIGSETTDPPSSSSTDSSDGFRLSVKPMFSSSAFLLLAILVTSFVLF